MKTKLTLLVISSSLMLAAPALLAQNNFATNDSTSFATNDSTSFATNDSTSFATNISISTSTVTNTQTRKYNRAFEGERSLLPPGLKEMLKLTEEQRTELKPIEDDFANTSQQYQTANQPRIDAALEANRQARASKDTAKIQAARKQMQQVWAGLQPYREAAVRQIMPLLTPDQLKVLEDPKNQWRENHADEANDPSAN